MNLHPFDFEGQHFKKGDIENVVRLANTVRLNELDGNVHTFVFNSAEEAKEQALTLEQYFTEEEHKKKTKSKKADKDE